MMPQKAQVKDKGLGAESRDLERVSGFTGKLSGFPTISAQNKGSKLSCITKIFSIIFSLRLQNEVRIIKVLGIRLCKTKIVCI